MSQPGGKGAHPEQEALGALESAVSQALDELRRVTSRARAAEKKSAELGKLMQRFTGDEEEAGRILTRLKRLELENADLRRRLDEGRAGVDRILAKIRFLENQK